MSLDNAIQIGAYTLDLERRLVRGEGGEQSLTGTEVALLDTLIRRRGRIVGREELHRRVWGHAGGGAGRAIDHVVKRLRKKLGRPSPLETVRGAGYRLDVPSAVTGDLPALAADRWIGRADDPHRIDRALARAPIVAVWGPPGVGCSRLALEYAHARRPRHPAGSWWIDLDGGRASVRQRVAETLGAPEADPLRFARDEEQPCLLVIDGADAETFATVEAWSRAARAVRFLLVAREAPGGAEQVEIAPLPPSLAALLLADRAAAVGASLDPADREVIALASQLDGLPAAIELAAAWTDVLSPAQLRGQLSDTVGPALDAAFASSLARLERWAVDALLQLSVFDAFTLEAAAAVLNLSRYTDAPRVPEAVRRLRRAAWLSPARASGADAQLRLSLLGTARAFLGRVSDARGVVEPARERHRRRFLDRTGRIDDAALRPDRGNLEAIVEDGTAPPLDRALATFLLYRARDPATEATGRTIARLDRAVAWSLGAGAPAPLAAKLLAARAASLRGTGDLHGAEESLQQALALPDLAPAHTTHLLGSLAGVLRDRGALAASAALIQRALGEVERLPPTHPERYRILSAAGALAVHQKRYAEAETLFQRFCALAEAHGTVDDRALGRVNLSAVHLDLGRLEEAEAELSAARTLRQGRPTALLDAHLWLSSARASLQRGDLAAAAAQAREGLAIAHHAGWGACAAWLLARLGEVQAYAGDPEAVTTLVDALCALRRAALPVHDALASAAAAAWHAGDTDSALARLMEAERSAPAEESPRYRCLRTVLLAASDRGEEASASHEPCSAPIALGARGEELAALASLAERAASGQRPPTIPADLRLVAQRSAVIRFAIAQLER